MAKSRRVSGEVYHEDLDYRTCVCCGEMKTLSNFHTDLAGTSHSGIRQRCYTCDNKHTYVPTPPKPYYKKVYARDLPKISSNRGSFADLMERDKRLEAILKHKKWEIRRLYKHFADITAGVYDKPQAVEIEQLYAYVAFLMTETIEEAVMVSKIPYREIREWAKKYNWGTQKKQHYQKVREKVMRDIGEELAEMQANMAVAVQRRMYNLVMEELDTEGLNELDRAKAVETYHKAFQSMLGTDKQDQPQIPGLSQNAQNIFMNINAAVPIEDQEKEWEALEALEAEMIAAESGTDNKRKSSKDNDDDDDDDN